MKKILKVYEKSFLVLIFTQSLFASPSGAVLPGGGGGGNSANPQEVINANISESEGNLKKTKVCLAEIKEINRKSQELAENFDITVYRTRLAYIQMDIVKIEKELRNEKDPKKRAEIQKDIQTIKAVYAELQKKK